MRIHRQNQSHKTPWAHQILLVLSKLIFKKSEEENGRIVLFSNTYKWGGSSDERICANANIGRFCRGSTAICWLTCQTKFQVGFSYRKPFFNTAKGRSAQHHTKTCSEYASWPNNCTGICGDCSSHQIKVAIADETSNLAWLSVWHECCLAIKNSVRHELGRTGTLRQM